MLKKKLLAALIAAVTSCSLAISAFAYPTDDPNNPWGGSSTTPIENSPSENPYEPPFSSDPFLSTDNPPATENPPVAPEPAQPEMTLNFYETSLSIGDGVQLVWTINNSPWENPPVGYTSSDPNVASIDGNGYITAVGAGTADITAYYENVSATASVTVVPPEPEPPEMTLNFYNTTLVIGEGVQLIWTIHNSPWENPAVGYTSSNLSVVRVDNNGYIIAIGTGTADVTAYYENVSATATVTVVQPEVVPEFLVLKQKSFELKIGAAAQIEAQLLPEDAAEGYTITYTSDNPDIAAVNENGAVTALQTGTAEIAVSGAGITEYVSVTVTSDIAYDTAKLDGYLYDNEGNPVVGVQLIIDALKAVTDTRGYFSFDQIELRELTLLVAGDNRAVCKITPQGDSTVYLLYRKGSPLTRLSTYEELVGQLPINTVSFVSGSNVILTPGETFELEYQYKPRDVSVTEIMYSTSNEIIAEVGQIDGIITAKAPGEADITISLNNGQANTTCHVVVNPVESSENSVLIIIVETALILTGVIIFIIIYRGYRKKLVRDLKKFDEEDDSDKNNDNK